MCIKNCKKKSEEKGIKNTKNENRKNKEINCGISSGIVFFFLRKTYCEWLRSIVIWPCKSMPTGSINVKRLKHLNDEAVQPVLNTQNKVDESRNLPLQLTLFA